jgi:glucokinase
VALGDAGGRILARERQATRPSGSARDDVARIAELARRVLRAAGVEAAQLAAVGVSAPGPLDRARGRLLGAPNLPGWGEVPICDWLAEQFGARVHLENDADAAALAEWRFGAGRGCAHMVFLTMSTGIGGGLVLDGRLYRGTGGAGEIGHAPVEWDGEPCACGARGCLEAYIGGAAWTRRLRAAAPDASAVVELAGGRARVRPEHVVAAAGQGDAYACAEMERFNDYLARAIVAIGFTLAPERVILGTIAVGAGEQLCIRPVRERVAARLWPAIGARLAILPAALGPELPDYAGLCAALEGLRVD